MPAFYVSQQVRLTVDAIMYCLRRDISGWTFVNSYPDCRLLSAIHECNLPHERHSLYRRTLSEYPGRLLDPLSYSMHAFTRPACARDPFNRDKSQGRITRRAAQALSETRLLDDITITQLLLYSDFIYTPTPKAERKGRREGSLWRQRP